MKDRLTLRMVQRAEERVASTTFGQPAGPRLMRGLGASIFPADVDYPAFDEVHSVAPSEAVWAARTLAATHHIASRPQTATIRSWMS